jgi:hypothetical protein
VNFFWLNATRNLNEIHRQAKEISIRDRQQSASIHKKRDEVQALIRDYQTVFSRISISLELTEGPKSFNALFHWCSSDSFGTVTNLADFGLNPTKLDLFLHNFLHLLPGMALSLNFASLAQMGPLPGSGLLAESFFFSSVLPSLFGHLWCSELTTAYLNFLFAAVDKNPSFRKSFLVQALTTFVRLTCGENYLNEVFGQSLLMLLRDEIAPSECAIAICQNMLTKRPLLSRVVQRLITEFDGRSEIMAPVAFVVECLITPTIHRPKESGALDPKLPLGIDEIDKLRWVGDLISIASTGDQSGPSVEIMRRLERFIDALKGVTPRTDQVSAVNVMSLLNVDSIRLQLSLPGIPILLKLVRECDVFVQLKALADQLLNDTVMPFSFYELDVCDLSIFGIIPRESKSASERAESKTQQANILFQLFDSIPVRWNAPQYSLSEFISFQTQCCQIQRHVMGLLLLDMIRLRTASWTPDRWTEFLPSLDDELQKRSKHLESQRSLFMELVGLHLTFNEMNRQLSHFSELIEQTQCGLLYAAFVSENPNCLNEFETQLDALARDPGDFLGYFRGSLKAFPSGIKEQQKLFHSFVLHHHCWLMNRLSFDRFMAFHEEFTDLDEKIRFASDETIQCFCVDPAPDKARRLFDSVGFSEAFRLLNAGRAAMLPILALPKISSAIELLNQLFALYFNQSAQADELTPLIHFLFLK